MSMTMTMQIFVLYYDSLKRLTLPHLLVYLSHAGKWACMTKHNLRHEHNDEFKSDTTKVAREPSVLLSCTSGVAILCTNARVCHDSSSITVASCVPVPQIWHTRQWDNAGTRDEGKQMFRVRERQRCRENGSQVVIRTLSTCTENFKRCSSWPKERSKWTRSLSWVS